MAEVRLQPRVAWPRQARVGGRYLVTVNIDPLGPPQGWPFDAEELAVHVSLRAGRGLSCRPLDSSVVLLHRFGGTYGPARFLVEGTSESEGAALVLDLYGPNGARLGRVKLGRVPVSPDVIDVGEVVAVPEEPEASEQPASEPPLPLELDLRERGSEVELCGPGGRILGRFQPEEVERALELATKFCPPVIGGPLGGPPGCL